MNWQDLTIGRRIGAGFGVVIILLIILGALSFTGVGGIVKNAAEVIDGKALDGVLAQREVDHLNWANAVNELISNEGVHTLSVQTDHTQCGFGKWLYGQGRKEAEILVPSLAPLFRKIETPHKALHDSAVEMQGAYARADSKLPEFIAKKEIDHLNWTAAIRGALLENKETIEVQTDHTQCGFGRWLYGDAAARSRELDAELGQLLEEIKTPHKALHATAIELIQAYRPSHPDVLVALREAVDVHRAWGAAVLDALMAFKTDLPVELDPGVCSFGRWLESEAAQVTAAKSPEIKSFLEKVKAPHEALHRSGQAVEKALKAGEFNRAEEVYKKRTNPALDELIGAILGALGHERELEAARNRAIAIFRDKTVPKLNETREVLGRIGDRSASLLEGYYRAAQIYSSQTAPALKEVQSLLAELRNEAKAQILTDQAMLDAAMSTKRNVAIVSGIAILAGLALAVLIARGIIGVLTRVTDELDQGAAQVAAASGQIASSSQSLAEGASQQAASIEETSSSLEEMASMTRQNADNAGNADRLTKDSQASVKASMAAMTELTRSMEEITQASEETSKIIKTIDEIAFQTNLLALNAAVEAARAGEAGAGFAVVADEVRNLAMRAAEAARDTAELIQGTTTRVAHGAGLVETTHEAFQKVQDNTGKVAALMGEISAASREQSEGIDQITTAVSQMDKVTQQNAANAEESASASEEMNAQAAQMKSIVDQLVKIVGASVTDRPVEVSGPKRKEKSLSRGGAAAKALPKKKAREIRPEQVIPLDEDEFKDF